MLVFQTGSIRMAARSCSSQLLPAHVSALDMDNDTSTLLPAVDPPSADHECVIQSNAKVSRRNRDRRGRAPQDAAETGERGNSSDAHARQRHTTAHPYARPERPRPHHRPARYSRHRKSLTTSLHRRALSRLITSRCSLSSPCPTRFSSLPS